MILNLARVVNSGKVDPKAGKLVRVVCPDCFTAVIVVTKGKRQVVICTSCKKKFEVKL
jgi:ribosomal protein S27E